MKVSAIAYFVVLVGIIIGTCFVFTEPLERLGAVLVGIFTWGVVGLLTTEAYRKVVKGF
jgi:positive regulator of sigma E activity